ncbi:MAG: hypothetical protein P1Q69_16235, partial [Candidatus Thorarchaeota archaeon]|nr:hypothetical protein [Candidatus Thorarchaeota archaeon]
MSKQRTLMVIGAGESQIIAIKSAKRMGHRVVAMDGSPNAKGREFADEFEVASTRDVVSAIKIARKYNIDGVLTVS